MERKVSLSFNLNLISHIKRGHFKREILCPHIYDINPDVIMDTFILLLLSNLLYYHDCDPIYYFMFYLYISKNLNYVIKCFFEITEDFHCFGVDSIKFNCTLTLTRTASLGQPNMFAVSMSNYIGYDSSEFDISEQISDYHGSRIL